MISLKLDSCLASLSNNSESIFSSNEKKTFLIWIYFCVDLRKKKVSNLGVGKICSLFWIKK